MVRKGQLNSAAVKARQEHEAYARKHYLLKRSIKALVFKNAALCDEVSRLKQRIATVAEERKILLRRLFHHKRLEQRRKQMAEKRLLHHQVSSSFSLLLSAVCLVAELRSVLQAMAALASSSSAVEGVGLQSPENSQVPEEKTLAAIAREAAQEAAAAVGKVES